MNPVKYYVALFVALCVVCWASSEDNFRPGTFIRRKRGKRKLELFVNYTATSQPQVMLTVLFKGEFDSASPKRHTFQDNTGELYFLIPSRYQLSPNITFTLPRSTFTLLLHTLPPPPAENLAEPIPDVHFEPAGDFIYAENADITFDVTVTSGVGRGDVSEEGLSYTSYVKEGEFFYVSEDWPVTVVKEEIGELESGGDYRLDFNISQGRPEGVLLLKAFKEYRPSENLQMIKAVEVEQRLDFYQQGHDPPVTSDTVALVKRWTDDYRGIRQVCDLSVTPACSASCAAIGSEVSEVRLWELSDWDMKKLKDSVTSVKMGFLTVTSAPLHDVTREENLGCQARIGESFSQVAEARVDVIVQKSAYFLEDSNSAVLYPNRTLEVRCVARGIPEPTITITESDAADKRPLEERFPNESFTRIIDINQQIAVQYWLSKTDFTSSLTRVQCSADNGVKDPDIVVLEVVGA